MNLGSFNIQSLVKQNADKIGFALGLFKDGTAPVFDSLQNLGAVHMPDWNFVLSDTLGDIKIPATALLASYLLGNVNLPMVGKIGKTVEKAAWSWIFGRVALSLLYRSTHGGAGSNSPMPYQTGSGSGNWTYPY